MSPARLKVALLGPHSIHYSFQKLDSIRTRKAWALLFYLLVVSIDQPGRKISREKLAALLWPEANEKSAKDNLRQALYQIRKAIPSVKRQGFDSEISFLDENPNGLGIHPNAEISSDLKVLKEVLSLSAAPPKAPIEIYRGDFLMDFDLPESPDFETWRDNYRALIRNQYLDYLSRLMQQHFQENDPKVCLQIIQIYLQQERAQELPYEIWMKLLIQQGQGLEAIRVYEKARKAFQKELDLPPGSTLLALRKKAEKLQQKTATDSRIEKKLPRIALMPFQLLPPNEADAYLKEGFLNELITFIARLPGIQLIHQNSIQRYLHSQKDPGNIPQEFDLDYLLEGSLQKQGERLKINLHWIDLQQQDYFWTASFDGYLKELFDLQLNIAKEASRQIKLKLGIRSSSASDSPPKIPFEAYDAFLKGRYVYFQATPDALREALHYFKKAVKLAPQFCQAHLEIATVLGSQISWWGDLRLQDVSAYFYKCMQQVKASPNYEAYKGHALAILAWFKLWEYKLPQALYFFQQSIQQSPPGHWAYPGLAHTYNLFGKHEQALEHARKGLELDPLLIQNYIVMAEALLLQGKLKAARQNAEQGLGLDANYAPGIATLAWIHIKEKSYDAAIRLCENKIAQLAKPPFFVIGRLAQAYAECGQAKMANRLISEMETAYANGQKGLAYFVGLAYVIMGKDELALDWLEKGFRMKETDLTWLKTQPEFHQLKGYPRYQNLLNALGLNTLD